MSYELRVESLKARVKTQNCVFKSTNYQSYLQVTSSNPGVTSSNPRVTSSNSGNTSSNPRVTSSDSPVTSTNS